MKKSPNLLLILVDSLNRHMLRPYNEKATAGVPNLERFAAKAHRFDSHFVGSLPCMPARREIFSGRKEFAWRPWGPLEAFDERLPLLLAQGGYTTGIVTDHYHYWEEEANGYIQGFQSSHLVRGHELDNWQQPLQPEEDVPRWVERIEEFRPGAGRRYYSNVREFEREEEYFPARVMTGAAEWLKRWDRQRPFFLQVESFDVHEPFHVPEPYASMYSASTYTDTGGADGTSADSANIVGPSSDFNIWPPYQDPAELRRYLKGASEEELGYLRSQYLGKLTMVDHWLGTLFDRLDELSLWEDTVVVVTTDHGHDLGERGVFGKQWPHFDSHAHIPLLMWHPNCPAPRDGIGGLTSTVDLFATMLDAAGSEPPSEPGHSRSMLPMLRGESNGRRAHLYGTFGQGVAITDGKWTLFKSPVDSPDELPAEAPAELPVELERPERLLYSYSPSLAPSLTARRTGTPVAAGNFIEGVELPQWKIPVRVTPLSFEDHLYDRENDPGMTKNLTAAEPRQRERMLLLMRQMLTEEGAPPELFVRLGL